MIMDISMKADGEQEEGMGMVLSLSLMDQYMTANGAMA